MSEKRGLVSSRSLSASDRIQLGARFQLNTTERARDKKRQIEAQIWRAKKKEKEKGKGSGFQSLSLKFIPVIDAACTREYIIVISSTDCMCATDFDLPPFLSPCSFHTVYAISLFSFLFFDLPFLALSCPPLLSSPFSSPSRRRRQRTTLWI